MDLIHVCMCAKVRTVIKSIFLRRINNINGSILTKKNRFSFHLENDTLTKLTKATKNVSTNLIFNATHFSVRLV